MSFVSETLRPVDDALDLHGSYEDCTLLRESPRGRIWCATRAGKRFILKGAASNGGKDISMLKREYELSIPLSHPGLAYVFTYEERSPVGPCIVMEHIDGRTLREYLAEGHALRERLRVLEQILDAVEYIHSRGVLHNDLSPENIIISRGGDAVKLIDFGFADDDVHYLAKRIGGTAGYASPELLEGRHTDVRSDIWSLGVLVGDIFGPSRFCTIRRRCTATLPERRYSSVTALKKAFARRRRLPAVLSGCIIAAALAIAGVHGASQVASMKAQLQERTDTDARRATAMEQMKGRVDAWYSENTTRFRQQAEGVAYLQRCTLWGKLVDDYNAFTEALMEECPEDLRADLIAHLALRFGKDFPTAE